ncbi:MAG: nucleotide pyrophosphohydrolase [Flavobacteriaceae bacterium]|nr:nucleotide pyrophosphohydrolase [Flavobacteriaceae bacterium]
MKETMFFDSCFPEYEQLPRSFIIDFDTIYRGCKILTKITYGNQQVGDFIDDNSREKDNYRFHDVFHYSFAAVLGWSPCSRSMMKRKRKSNPDIDDFEDGARAIITEEAISLMIFNYAKKRNLLAGDNCIDSKSLEFIKDFTSPFEVSVCTEQDWEKAIFLGYSLFRSLVENNGGRISFDMINKTGTFSSN